MLRSAASAPVPTGGPRSVSARHEGTGSASTPTARNDASLTASATYVAPHMRQMAKALLSCLRISFVEAQNEKSASAKKATVEMR